MKNQGADEIVRRIREVLLTEPGLRLALAHGSVTNGRLRPDSDVDVAVLFDRPLNAAHKMRLVERLQAASTRTVDLADLSALNGTILRRIICQGQILVKKDSADFVALAKRMVYHQADMMPYVRRTLAERQKGFVHG